MFSYENYSLNGFELVDTQLDTYLSKLKLEMISVFSEISSIFGLGSISNDSEIAELYTSKNHDVWAAAYDQLRYLPRLVGLVNNPEILEIVKKCGIKFPSLSTRPILRVDMPNGTKHDFPAHQDYSYNQGSLNSITIWIPLQGVNEKMGALQIIPKSHMDESVPSKDGLIINPNLEKFVTVPTKLGQVLVFSQFLHHKSGKNNSEKIRFSIQLRYNDLSDESWGKRKYYINEEVSVKTHDVKFETYFQKENNCIQVVSE